jgi:hypothetical protein
MSDTADGQGLGFSYRVRKCGGIEVLRHGRIASTLRGAAAIDLHREVQAASGAEAQQIMARVTGNYRRGNERTARQHPRNRR